jgi:outer membrane protein OmpA-like peptidoglycan-associated protein
MNERMKHIIQTVIIAALAISFFCSTADAKQTLPGVTYRNLKIRYNEQTGKVDLSFEAVLKKDLSINYSLLFVPRLEKSGKEKASMPQLPGVAMEGAWYRISRHRHERSHTYREVIPDTLSYVHPAKVYTYKASVPYKQWVEGVSLVVYSTLKTYGGITGSSVFTFGDLLSMKAERPAKKVNTKERPEQFRPYIELIDDVNRPIVAGTASIGDVENYIEIHGEGSLTLYFETSSSRISPDLMSNRETIDKLMEAARDLKSVGNGRPRVVIVGYSSPEGKAETNQRLANERALAVQELIATRSELSIADIITYGAGTNWAGLKRLVTADEMTPNRNEVLTILDAPIWDTHLQTGRLGSLMRLNGGATYRYMLKYHFPQLRGAAFIKLFYE